MSNSEQSFDHSTADKSRVEDVRAASRFQPRKFGPWEVGGPHPSVSVIECVEQATQYDPPAYDAVAILGEPQNEEQREYALAVAHLIAAAPDGLELAERMYSWFLAIEPGMPHYIVRIQSQGEMAALRDFIAKATGRTPQDVQDEFETRAARGV